MRVGAAALALWALVGCQRAAPSQPRRAPAPPTTAPAPPATTPAPAPWSEAWLLAEGARYLDDPGYRRSALEASLTEHRNNYAQLRLSHYGLGASGWDNLPAWSPRVAPVTVAFSAPDAAPLAPLWDRRRPSTLAEWIALGHKVFTLYPMRAERFIEWGLGRREVLSAHGVVPDAQGAYPGLVAFRDLEDRPRVGITCALCHSAPHAGGWVMGRARRRFDYGALRLAYHRDTGTPVEPSLAARMATWGPGRADVTEDEAEDPVAIPDLFGLRHQRYLNQAGTLRHLGPVTLALRQETQLLDSNHQAVRPPRELAWALAMYLYSLTFSPVSAPATPASQRGEAVFSAACRSCHESPILGGDAIAVARVGTDPALAMGSARGTGRYRVAALRGVREAGPWLHDGSLARLEDLFSEARFAPDFARRVGRPGPVVGHRFGLDLSARDKADLLAYLATR